MLVALPIILFWSIFLYGKASCVPIDPNAGNSTSDELQKATAVCNLDRNWEFAGPIFNNFDCRFALNQFRDALVRGHKSQDVEFYDPSRPPIYGISPTWQLPSRWQDRTCVLGVALEHQLPGKLPGGFPGGAHPSLIYNDIATFQSILEEANNIIHACTIARKLGWIVTGKQQAIVVAFWGAGSKIDYEIQRFTAAGQNLFETAAAAEADDPK